MKTKNEFLLKGGITSIHSARTVSRMVVATDGGGLTAFVNVVFFPDVDISNFKLGDRVTVKGHVQFQILRDSAGNTTGYRQTLIADSIELTPRLLAAFIKEDSNLYNGGVQADENEILLFGRVSHVFDTTNGAVIITIQIPRTQGSFVDNCNVVCFKRQAEEALKLKKGDCILTYNVVRTRRNDKTETFEQNLICRDILKIAGFENS